MENGKEKPKYNMWQNSAFMMQQAWRYNKIVLWTLVVIAALALANSLLGLFVTPTIINAVEEQVPLGQLVRIILLFVGGLMLVGGARGYFDTIVMLPRVFVRLRIYAAINNKTYSTSYPNTENQDARKLANRALLTTDSDHRPTQAIWVTLSGLLTTIAGFIVYLILLRNLEPWIIAVVLVTTVTGFFCTRYINGWGYRHRKEEAEYSRRMYYVSNKAADYHLAKDLRIFGMGSWLEDMYTSSLALYQNFLARRERVYIWGNIIDVALSFLRNGVAYIFLIYMVIDGGLPAATFLLYFVAVGGLTEWVSGILSGFSTLHIQSLEISALREYLDYEEPFKLDGGIALKPNGQNYEFCMKNVSFRHPAGEKDVLKNVNLTIPAGEKLAIVGLNGAGKTTLIKLLCGLYDPTDGEVLLNGQDIKQYNRRDYYEHFSAVFQDFSILATTILDNVSQSHDEPDMERVKWAIEMAGLTEKIESLPEQYNTNVGREIFQEGLELSGGETQRLMLARALYKNAPIIVLDEPTAALDPIAERDIYNKYNELCGGKTAVYISHRLASTRFCDRIILIEDGQIIEEGTHESLVALGGKYAELFEVQSHYYREEAVQNA